MPTIIVAAAVLTMIMLGFWQLGRADEKGAMIARYQAAESAVAVPFPLGSDAEPWLFHRSSLECVTVISREAIAGRNARGQTGYAHIARCETGGGEADIKLGWSRSPEFPDWAGGPVEGLIAPGGADGARLQMAVPAEGLAPLAQPDPADVPNNHLAYAGQWFLFAITALVIYILALRRRHKPPLATDTQPR